MLSGSFTKLWNTAVFSVGAGWVVLVYFIWDSTQLVTMADRQVFLVVMSVGFLVVYAGGFIIDGHHRKKKRSVS